MKKTLVMIAVFAVIVAFSVPASAQWTVSWTENFEHYAHGGVVPAAFNGASGGWATVAGAANTGQIVHDPAGSVSPNHYWRNQPGTKSATSNNMRVLNDKNSLYKEAFLEGWIFDPMAGTVTTDTRIGLHSSLGADNIGKMVTANITSGTGLTGDTAYWRAQWSYSAVSMNGVSPAGGAGYTFTAGPAAPRVAGWNKVWMYYTMNEALTSFTVDWYINPDPAEPVINLSLTCTSAAARWANFHEVQGVYVGPYNVSGNSPGRVDDLAFYGNTIDGTAVQKDFSVTPEPSSFLALGAGLMGVIGMIRRRK